MAHWQTGELYQGDFSYGLWFIMCLLSLNAQDGGLEPGFITRTDEQKLEGNVKKLDDRTRVHDDLENRFKIKRNSL